jgi:hypothetical protein
MAEITKIAATSVAVAVGTKCDARKTGHASPKKSHAKNARSHCSIGISCCYWFAKPSIHRLFWLQCV